MINPAYWMHHHVWVEADCFFFLSLFIRSVLCHYKKVVVRNTVWRLHRSLTGRCKDHPYKESTVFICWMRACKTMTVIDLNLKITSPSICFMQGQWGKGGLHPGRVAWLSQGWHPETNNHKHKHSHLKAICLTMNIVLKHAVSKARTETLLEQFL